MIGLIGMFIFLWHQPCTWSSMSDLKKHSDEQRTLSLTFDLRVMVNQEGFQPSQASNEFSNAAPMRALPGISMACIMTSPKHKRTVTGVLAETWGSRAWPSWIVLAHGSWPKMATLEVLGPTNVDHCWTANLWAIQGWSSMPRLLRFQQSPEDSFGRLICLVSA